MIPVNSTQFRRTVRLCNSQKISIFNMNQPFFSDIKMCQCHITTFRTCSPLVLLYLILFLRFFFSSMTIQNPYSKVAFAIRWYTYLVIYSYNQHERWHRKEFWNQPYSLWKTFNFSSEPKQYKWEFLSLNSFSYVICLSETYLKPSAPLHDVNLEIQGYELVRSDHP